MLRTILSAVAWLLALALYFVPDLPAWALPVIEPFVPAALMQTDVQGQQVLPSLAVLSQPPTAGAVGATGVAGKSSLLQPSIQAPLTAQGGAVGAYLPVHATEGWSGESAESVAGVYTPGHRLSDWQELARASQGLTGGAFKEIVGSSDVKTALLALNIELKNFVAGTVFEAPSPNPVDSDPPRRTEIKSPFGEATRPSGPPLTAAERELDTLRASVMFWQLINEVKPWALSMLFLYWSFLVIRGYLRMQRQRRISTLQARSRRHKRQASRAVAHPPAAQ
jgi:hypothetical protein